MQNDFSNIRNEANETAVIDITGVIGFDWWEEKSDKNNTYNRLQASLNAIKVLNAKEITVK